VFEGTHAVREQPWKCSGPQLGVPVAKFVYPQQRAHLIQTLRDLGTAGGLYHRFRQGCGDAGVRGGAAVKGAFAVAFLFAS
jgi:anaerobic glycerol-3-phosphate dehydrogenase